MCNTVTDKPVLRRQGVCMLQACSCPSGIKLFPLPSSRKHLSYDVSMEDKRQIIITILCCLAYGSHAQWYAHTWAVLKDKCWFKFGFFCIYLCVFLFSLACYVLGFALVVLGLVSLVLCQEIGWEEHLRNDLNCVEWDVKTLSESMNQVMSVHTASLFVPFQY